VGLIIRWAITFASVLMTGYLAQLLPYQFFTYADLESAAIFAVVLGLVNAIIRPIVALLTLPLTCLTLGLFTAIINGVLFLLAAFLMEQVALGGIGVNGLVGAVVASLIISAVSTFLSRFVGADA